MQSPKQKQFETVKVFIRFKPLISENAVPLVYTSSNDKNGSQTLVLKNTHFLTPKRKEHSYRFDEIFPAATTQEAIFEEVASPMIDKFVQDGVNGTIFGYGQTGSGKTYTLCGLKRAEDRGVIQRTFRQLFDHVEASDSAERFEIKLSFVEIYNNRIRDLTKSTPESSAVVHFSSNITRVSVNDESNATKLFKRMILNRKTSATKANEYSSRSHFICTIYVTKYDHEVKVYESEFNIVDLAGNESYDINASKTTKSETRAVNESLFHLQQVTKKLANPNFKGKISYRTSKLTSALQKTLSKNCSIALIANVHSSNKCLKETVNTLEFATEVASIKKHVVVQTSQVATSFKTKYENLMVEHALLEDKYAVLQKKFSKKKCGNCDKTMQNPASYPGMTLLTQLNIGNVESAGDSVFRNVVRNQERIRYPSLM